MDYRIWTYLKEFRFQEQKLKYNPYTFDIDVYNLCCQNLKDIDILNGLKEIDKYTRKKKRLSKRIAYMLNERCWFITLTIEDKYMNRNHKRKIQSIYKGLNYIFNEDYGTKGTERLHYHGIVQSKEKPQGWNYGFYNIKEITFKHEKKLRSYILKLSEHSIKESANKIIYSRVCACKLK